MGAWYDVSFYPGSGRPLDAANAVAWLVSNGFDVSSCAHRLVPSDQEGHVECDYDNTISLRGLEDLQEQLENGEQLFVEITKDDIASNGTDTIVTTFACSFALKTSNPNFSFGWHKRLFSRLPPETQQWYWRAIRDAAKAAKATYVVLAVEPPGYVEDRFIEMDGKRVLDTHVNHQWGHGFWAVWVDRSTGAACPEGVRDTVAADLGNGFVEYSVG